jgi:hypothetical protein
MEEQALHNERKLQVLRARVNPEFAPVTSAFLKVCRKFGKVWSVAACGGCRRAAAFVKIGSGAPLISLDAHK